MAIILKAATPARSDRAIVLAADGKYIRFALFAAEQLARLHPQRDFDICLCSADEVPEVPASLAADGFRRCQVLTDDTFSGLRLDPGRSQVVYLKLALPAAFAGDYRRILYLDSDIFVQHGDFGALLGLNLGGRVLGAVRDNIQWRAPGRRPAQYRRLGLPASPYFNAGLLLIDVERYNAVGLMQRCVELGRAEVGRMIRHDQNLLNATLRGDWAELSPLWNWQYTRATMLFEALEGAHLVHFIGPRKPWAHSGGALPLKFRHAYRDFFAEHFPEATPIGTDGKAPHQNRRYLRQMLGRHFVAVGKMCDYLDRFPSDLTVL